MKRVSTNIRRGVCDKYIRYIFNTLHNETSLLIFLYIFHKIL